MSVNQILLRNRYQTWDYFFLGRRALLLWRRGGAWHAAKPALSSQVRGIHEMPIELRPISELPALYDAYVTQPMGEFSACLASAAHPAASSGGQSVQTHFGMFSSDADGENWASGLCSLHPSRPFSPLQWKPKPYPPEMARSRDKEVQTTVIQG